MVVGVVVAGAVVTGVVSTGVVATGVVATGVVVVLLEPPIERTRKIPTTITTMIPTTAATTTSWRWPSPGGPATGSRSSSPSSHSSSAGSAWRSCDPDENQSSGVANQSSSGACLRPSPSGRLLTCQSVLGAVVRRGRPASRVAQRRAALTAAP